MRDEKVVVYCCMFKYMDSRQEGSEGGGHVIQSVEEQGRVGDGKGLPEERAET